VTSYPTEITAGTAAQEQLRAIARDLGDIRDRLRTVVASLLAEKTEEPPEDEEDDMRSDLETEVRSVAECVLADNIRPAIDDLLAAANYRAGEG
jgi:hypothetical protein